MTKDRKPFNSKLGNAVFSRGLVRKRIRRNFHIEKETDGPGCAAAAVAVPKKSVEFERVREGCFSEWR